MPSARELLQQADALMRRNRRRGKFKGGNDTTLSGADATLSGADATLSDDDATLTGEGRDVPTLTDALAVDADPISLDTLADLPVLTDAVAIADDGEVASLPARAQMLEPLVPEEAAALLDASATSPVAEAASSREAEPALEEALRGRDNEPLPAAGAVPQLPSIAAASAGLGPAEDEFILEIPPAGDETAAPAAAPAIAAASPDWNALADEIRSQVLQRLDLFTDTGLREQLGARLQPIVERASAELVDTINRQVGELIRSYIAEAIEREIDSWRSHHS